MKKLHQNFFTTFVLMIASIILFTSCDSKDNERALVTARWLHDNIDFSANNSKIDNLVVLDIRGEEAYNQGHIPSAIMTDFSIWNQTINGTPGMLPSSAYMQALIQALGIDTSSHVVIVFDPEGAASWGPASRIYWTLSLSGLSNLSILDGGYKVWNAQQYPLTQEASLPSPSDYQFEQFDTRYLASIEDVQSAIDDSSITLIDARKDAFFSGEIKSPDVKTAGTIETAISLPQVTLFNADGTVKSREALEQIAKEKQLQKRESIITFCNTAQNSSIDWFVFSELLDYRISMYDGSLAEWTQLGGTTKTK